jgi:hypothetical protein
MRRREWVVCLLLGASACRGAHGDPSLTAIDPRAVPEQREVAAADAAEVPETIGGARLTPRARYRIAARVLSTERYYLGWRSELSPIDLALGWAAMSDPAVDRFIDWHQGGRWYFWHWSAESPYRNDVIHVQSANVHIIPGSPNLRRALLALDADDIVQLSGYLTDVTGPDGERWGSSLSRTDTGDHSCELLYVTELVAGERAYR